VNTSSPSAHTPAVAASIAAALKTSGTSEQRREALVFHAERREIDGNGIGTLARHGPNRPLSVMYAEIATKTSTTNERMLQPPSRTRFLFAQPPATLIPTPKRTPLASRDSQASLGRS
jgi:hypothetical protein